MAATPRIAKPAVANAMLASASRIKTQKDLRRARKNNQWIKDGWMFYDMVGEYRYACDWTGAMVSKAELKAGWINDHGEVEEAKPNTRAAEVVSALFGDANSKREALRKLGIHFQVGGEAWVLSYTNDYDLDEWIITSSQAVSRATDDGPWKVDGEEVADPDDYVERLWRPHPSHPGQAISSTKAVLPVLEEINGLHQHVMAQVESRLASNGLMLWPSEMKLPEGGEYANMSMADAFTKLFSDIASVALTNRGSAPAVVPIMVTGPSEHLDKVRHISLWTDLDEQSSNLRGDALRRLALGMDLPPEIITGSEGVNHWTSFSIDESAIKSHTEPLLNTITTALTKGLLLPDLHQNGVQDLGRWVIWADTAQMRLRPNRSKEAIELYDRGVIGATALLKETGFDPEDAPTTEELRRWILTQIASGSATPDMVAAAAAMLGADMPVVHVGSDEGDPSPTREAPSLVDHPEQGPPDKETGERRKRNRDEIAGRPPTPMSLDPALVASCWMAVERALERAGNRMRTLNGFSKQPGVSAAEQYRYYKVGGDALDDVLGDAWGCVPGIAQRHGIDTSDDELASALDNYARSLLLSQQPICQDDLEHALSPWRK